MIHLYCLLPAGSEGPGALAGVAGAPVRRLHADALEAWISDAPGDLPARDVAAARAHDAVVAAALGRGTTPLPARFDQHFASEAECAAALERQAPALRASLERIAGQVEMTVAVRLAAPPDAPAAGSVSPRPAGGAPGSRGWDAKQPGAGRSYLEHLKAELASERIVQDAADRARGRIAAVLGALAHEERAERTASPPTLFLSHLIPRDMTERYRSAVAGLAGDPQLPALVVLGPSAPYRFATAADVRA